MLLFSLIQIAKLNAQPIVSIWTIVASVAAVISSISAFMSRGYAKRSYELARKNYSDKQANFSLYLIDGYRLTKEETATKYLLYHITIMNKSDGKSSFKAELEIVFLREDNSTVTVIVSHDENLQNKISQNQVSVFPNDIRIEEKGMQSKWLIFEQPTNPFKQYRIDKYMIKITDIQGNKQIVESAFVKDFYNEK